MRLVEVEANDDLLLKIQIPMGAGLGLGGILTIYPDAIALLFAAPFSQASVAQKFYAIP